MKNGMRYSVSVRIGFLVLGMIALGRAATESPEQIQQNQPKTDSPVVAEGAAVEKLADGFGFVEGPAADAHGDVYFSDIPNERIHKYSVADHKTTVFLENSGRANGLFFAPRGNLYGCAAGNRCIFKIAFKDGMPVLDEQGKPAVITVVDQYGGKKLNSPNDLWMDARGIYFTDPRYGRDRDDMEQDGEYVYYVSPDRKTVVRVIDDMVRPNGLIASLDGRMLYVADHGSGKTWRYMIQENGMLAEKTLFAPVGSDGMTIDEKGNIYLTTDSVEVYDPEGKRIETIAVPERPSNVTFGGPDHKTLFITARTSLYGIQMKVTGAH